MPEHLQHILGIDIGHVSNQNFVSIPVYRFETILWNTAAKCSTTVVVREESYTSKTRINKIKYADEGFLCCMFLNKDECSDIKEKGESACQKCVREMVQKEAEKKYTNH